MGSAAIPPVLPPEVAAQQQQQQQPGFMQAGQAMGGQQPGGDQVAQLEQMIGQLEKVTGDLHQLIQTVHPPAGALLVPIAQAGKALKEQVAELRKRQAGPTGESAGMRPQPTPAEGATARPPV